LEVLIPCEKTNILSLKPDIPICSLDGYFLEMSLLGIEKDKTQARLES